MEEVSLLPRCAIILPTLFTTEEHLWPLKGCYFLSIDKVTSRSKPRPSSSPPPGPLSHLSPRLNTRGTWGLPGGSCVRRGLGRRGPAGAQTLRSLGRGSTGEERAVGTPWAPGTWHTPSRPLHTGRVPPSCMSPCFPLLPVSSRAVVFLKCYVSQDTGARPSFLRSLCGPHRTLGWVGPLTGQAGLK